MLQGAQVLAARVAGDQLPKMLRIPNDGQEIVAPKREGFARRGSASPCRMTWSRRDQHRPMAHKRFGSRGLVLVGKNLHLQDSLERILPRANRRAQGKRA